MSDDCAERAKHADALIGVASLLSFIGASYIALGTLPKYPHGMLYLGVVAAVYWPFSSWAVQEAQDAGWLP